MQTYSHLLITAALISPLKSAVVTKQHLPIPVISSKALLFGALLPDLALILIALVCISRDWFSGVFASEAWANHQTASAASTELSNLSWTASLFDDWFFNNPIIITLQNTFHSPIILIALITIFYWAWKNQTVTRNNWTSCLFWAFCAALLHTLIDIPLHSTDGPLIFFPLDWNYRFPSPVSYWDSVYHGDKWAVFEHCLDLALIIFLIVQWRTLSKKF